MIWIAWTILIIAFLFLILFLWAIYKYEDEGYKSKQKYYCAYCNFYGSVWEIIAHKCKRRKKR